MHKTDKCMKRVKEISNVEQLFKEHNFIKNTNKILILLFACWVILNAILSTADFFQS